MNFPFDVEAFWTWGETVIRVFPMAAAYTVAVVATLCIIAAGIFAIYFAIKVITLCFMAIGAGVLLLLEGVALLAMEYGKKKKQRDRVETQEEVKSDGDK